uniref:Farnesyl pyrophosphate synthase n=1 Tax=Rhabditophanes sp. KR3021 TaxID=114890 RepID=A0AC35U0T3_9BILA
MSHLQIAKTLKHVRAFLPGALSLNLHQAETNIVKTRLDQLFDHAVLGGKNTRSRLLVDSYSKLKPSASVQEMDNVSQVAVTIEMLQAFLLIVDDIMDDSKLRRGKECWYRVPGIGMNAINDGLLLDCSIDLVIRDAIPTHPNLHQIIAAIYEAKRKTTIGQLLDGQTAGGGNISWARYKQLVEHKTSHYTFYCPLQMAMLMGDVVGGLREIKTIAYDLGYLFQAKDDYLDCFVDEGLTGKTSTDIAEGKCSWIGCSTLDKLKGEPKLKKVFEECYGKNDSKSVDICRTLIGDLKIDNQFHEFEKMMVKKLSNDIDNFSVNELKPILHDCLEQIVKPKGVDLAKEKRKIAANM